MTFIVPEHPLHALSLRELRGRTSAKWQRYDADVLPLWVAEMDVPLAQPIVDAVHTAMVMGDTGYGIGDAYAEAFAEFALARWNWQVDLLNTVGFIDVVTGITDVIATISGPEVPVVLTPPVYGPFYDCVASLGRQILPARLTPEGRLNPETLEARFAEIAKAGTGGIVLICNPHNPTGVAHTRAELEMLVSLASTYGIRIVSDEIHGPLQMPGHVFTPILTLAGAETAIVVTSASKAFNLAGLKAALIVGGPASREQLSTLREGHMRAASHLGVIAQSAAFRHGSPWLDAVIDDLDANRRLLGDLIAEHLPGARYYMPESTYLAWVDCRALDLGGDPAEIFEREGRVAFTPGTFFGEEGAGHIRVNFATSPEILTEALQRAGSVLRGR